MCSSSGPVKDPPSLPIARRKNVTNSTIWWNIWSTPSGKQHWETRLAGRIRVMSQKENLYLQIRVNVPLNYSSMTLTRSYVIIPLLFWQYGCFRLYSCLRDQHDQRWPAWPAFASLSLCLSLLFRCRFRFRFYLWFTFAFTSTLQLKRPPPWQRLPFMFLWIYAEWPGT